MPAKQASRTMLFPSPVGGLNSRDAYDNMPPEDAVQMINFFPETSYVRTRGPDAAIGVTNDPSWTTASVVDAIIPYSSSDVVYAAIMSGGVPRIAYVDKKSTDPTFAPLAINALLPTAGAEYTGYPVQTMGYGNASGYYTLIFGGFNIVMYWDGTATGFQNCNFAFDTSTGATDPGFNSSQLTMGCIYANRIFMPQYGSLFVWYPSTTESFQGPCQYLDLRAYVRLGGYVTNVCTWTYTSSLGGIFQVLACITSEGEVVIYNGTDPTNSADWNIVGQYSVGRPVAGSRATQALGPDALLLCEDGIQPLQSYLQGGKDKAAGNAISQKINGIFSAAILQFGETYGWQVVVFPSKTMALVNVPTAAAAHQVTFYNDVAGVGTQLSISLGTQFVQYVWNLITGSWTQWTTPYPTCNWVVIDNKLMYAANNGTVDLFLFQADLTAIEAATFAANTPMLSGGDPFLQTAFQYPNQSVQHHLFQMAQPTFISAEQVTANISISNDFALATPPAYGQSVVPAPSVISNPGNGVVQTPWVGLAAYGMPASLALTVGLTAYQARFYNTKVLYQEGGTI